MGTSLVVQWLRLHASNAGDAGSIPGQELGSRMLHSTAKKLKTYMLKFLWSRLGILGQYHQGAPERPQKNTCGWSGGTNTVQGGVSTSAFPCTHGPFCDFPGSFQIVWGMWLQSSGWDVGRSDTCLNPTVFNSLPLQQQPMSSCVKIIES